MEPFWLRFRLRFSIFTKPEVLLRLRLRLQLHRQWKPAFTETNENRALEELRVYFQIFSQITLQVQEVMPDPRDVAR